MPTLKTEERDFIAKLGRARFKYFCQLFIPDDWFDEDFHGSLCNFLQFGDTMKPGNRRTLVRNGKEIKGAIDKLVVMPRTHLKTTIAAQFFSLWKAVKDPEIRQLITSNTLTNAQKTVHSIRGIVEGNPLYQALYPETLPRSWHREWSDTAASLNRLNEWPEATFEAAGIGSSIIRRHFNHIIEDDTVSPSKDQITDEEILPTLDELQKAIGFHKLTIPLLISPDSDERTVIGTRWAAADLIQHIYDKELEKAGGRFHVWDVPAYTAEGTPAYKRFSEDTLRAIRRAMGEYMFSALYLNKPMSSDFMKFRPEWVRYYTFSDPIYQKAKEDGYVVVTVDAADPPTGKESQCYTAITPALRCKFGMFLLPYVRERLTHDQLLEAIIKVGLEWDARVIRIEADKYAYLKEALQMKMRDKGVHLHIEMVKTKGRKKEARIMGLQPFFENRMVYFLKGQTSQLESEMYTFPRGVTVDILDALAWQVDFNLAQLVSHTSFDQDVEEHASNMVTFSFDEIMAACGLGATQTTFFSRQR